jgi:hypothetical protein
MLMFQVGGKAKRAVRFKEDQVLVDAIGRFVMILSRISMRKTFGNARHAKVCASS